MLKAAGVALALWTGVMVVLDMGSPADAWSEVPHAVSAAEADQLRTECENLVRNSRPPLTFQPSGVTLAEKRGTTRSVLIAGLDNRVAICIGQSDQKGALEVGSDFAGIYDLSPLTGPLRLDDTQRYSPPRVVFGRAEQRLDRIEIVTTDNKTVTASIGQGYFLAWWPSNANASEVRAFDAAGNIVDGIELAPSGS